jgi:hypothetical protein
MVGSITSADSADKSARLKQVSQIKILPQGLTVYMCLNSNNTMILCYKIMVYLRHCIKAAVDVNRLQIF